MKRGIVVEPMVVDDQSGPGPPFLAVTENQGQGPLSPHHVKASPPRGYIFGAYGLNVNENNYSLDIGYISAIIALV